MPRAKENKLYRTFVRGLITEAGYLTYPEDSSVNELNTVLSRKGNRQRRLGIDYESGFSFNSNSYNIVLDNTNKASNEYVWKSVNNDVSVNFLAVQQAEVVYFYALGSNPISGHKKVWCINFSLYIRPGATLDQVQTTNCSMISGKGYLFVAHPHCEPLVVIYRPNTDSVDVIPTTIKVRDFDGVDDGFDNDYEPPSLSNLHQYNLQNQGWVSTSQNPITKYYTTNGVYPGNNKQWWTARATVDDTAATPAVYAGDFLPKVLYKLFSGSSRAPMGHYILNAFRKDRTAASGLSGFAIEDLNYRPKAVGFYSGRVWWGAGSSCYYSQILTDISKAGLCYQEADPTAEDISDLIASDGGVIPIPEADDIVALVPQSNGLLVFATNGVWFVSGGSAQGFSARDIEVSKISPIGTLSPFSIVALDNGVYYWSNVGIQALQQSFGQYGPIPGKFGNTNIAEQTIQTFYNAIPESSRALAKGCFDPRNNCIQWLYNDGTYNETFKYNSVLNLDLTLQAFYPWKVSDNNIGTDPKICGIFLDIGEPVVYNKTIPATRLTYIVSLTNSGVTSNTFAQFRSTSYVDWLSYNGGMQYDSFVETGYELLEDAMRRKQVVYVVTHVRRVENDYSGALIGACGMQLKWDWSSAQFSNKWTGSYECYVPIPDVIPGSSRDTSVNAKPTNVRKSKVRGSGRAIQFRFGTNERGRTFDLLGWQAAYVGNTEP